MTSDQPSPSLPDRFVLIIGALCGALAVRCARDRAVAPIGLLLWRRLHRAAARFNSLFLRWREGRLRPPRPRPKRERTAAAPAPRLPGGFAWLVRLVPGAAVYGAHLQQLLAEPDFSALLAEVPQAGRMFRPLCRMLGVQPLPEMLRPPELKMQGGGMPAPVTRAAGLTVRQGSVSDVRTGPDRPAAGPPENTVPRESGLLLGLA